MPAKFVYDVRPRLLRACWNEKRIPTADAVTPVKARCPEDERFAFPLSDRSPKDPASAYDELRLAGVSL